MIEYEPITKREESGWIPGGRIVFPGPLGVLTKDRFEAGEYSEDQKHALERARQLEAKLIDELTLDYCRLMKSNWTVAIGADKSSRWRRTND